MTTVNVWIAGSTGTEGDFKNSLLENVGLNDNEITTIEVSIDGSIISRENDSSALRNISVVFQDNGFTESVLENNPNLLDNILMSEYTIKRFDNINIIGHSNGGNILTRWIERYEGYRPFSVIRMVTICTPFNGYVVQGADQPTGFLKEVLNNNSKLNGISKKAFGAYSGYNTYRPYTGNNSETYAGDTVVTLANAKTAENVLGVSLDVINGQTHMGILNSNEVKSYLESFIN